MIRARLNDALKEAVKAKDQCAVSTLRLTLAALKDRDIAARGKGESNGVTDDEILELLQKMIRQRRESIEAFTKAGRQDLVDKETAEIEVIEHFLPEQLSEKEMQEAIGEVIQDLDAHTIKDVGRVMGALKQRYPGRMDFGKAGTVVKAELA